MDPLDPNELIKLLSDRDCDDLLSNVEVLLRCANCKLISNVYLQSCGHKYCRSCLSDHGVKSCLICHKPFVSKSATSNRALNNILENFLQLKCAMEAVKGRSDDTSLTLHTSRVAAPDTAADNFPSQTAVAAARAAEGWTVSTDATANVHPVHPNSHLPNPPPLLIPDSYPQASLSYSSSHSPTYFSHFSKRPDTIASRHPTSAKDHESVPVSTPVIEAGDTVSSFHALNGSHVRTPSVHGVTGGGVAEAGSCVMGCESSKNKSTNEVTSASLGFVDSEALDHVKFPAGNIDKCRSPLYEQNIPPQLLSLPPDRYEVASPSQTMPHPTQVTSPLERKFYADDYLPLSAPTLSPSTLCEESLLSECSQSELRTSVKQSARKGNGEFNTHNDRYNKTAVPDHQDAVSIMVSVMEPLDALPHDCIAVPTGGSVLSGGAGSGSCGLGLTQQLTPTQLATDNLTAGRPLGAVREECHGQTDAAGLDAASPSATRGGMFRRAEESNAAAKSSRYCEEYSSESDARNHALVEQTPRPFSPLSSTFSPDENSAIDYSAYGGLQLAGSNDQSITYGRGRVKRKRHNQIVQDTYGTHEEREEECLHREGNVRGYEYNSLAPAALAAHSDAEMVRCNSSGKDGEYRRAKIAPRVIEDTCAMLSPFDDGASSREVYTFPLREKSTKRLSQSRDHFSPQEDYEMCTIADSIRYSTAYNVLSLSAEYNGQECMPRKGLVHDTYLDGISASQLSAHDTYLCSPTRSLGIPYAPACLDNNEEGNNDRGYHAKALLSRENRLDSQQSTTDRLVIPDTALSHFTSPCSKPVTTYAVEIEHGSPGATLLSSPLSPIIGNDGRLDVTSRSGGVLGAIPMESINPADGVLQSPHPRREGIMATVEGVSHAVGKTLTRDDVDVGSSFGDDDSNDDGGGDCHEYSVSDEEGVGDGLGMTLTDDMVVTHTTRHTGTGPRGTLLSGDSPTSPPWVYGDAAVDFGDRAKLLRALPSLSFASSVIAPGANYPNKCSIVRNDSLLIEPDILAGDRCDSTSVENMKIPDPERRSTTLGTTQGDCTHTYSLAAASSGVPHQYIQCIPPSVIPSEATLEVDLPAPLSRRNSDGQGLHNAYSVISSYVQGYSPPQHPLHEDDSRSGLDARGGHFTTTHKSNKRSRPNFLTDAGVDSVERRHFPVHRPYGWDNSGTNVACDGDGGLPVRMCEGSLGVGTPLVGRFDEDKDGDAGDEGAQYDNGDAVKVECENMESAQRKDSYYDSGIDVDNSDVETSDGDAEYTAPGGAPPAQDGRDSCVGGGEDCTLASWGVELHDNLQALHRLISDRCVPAAHNPHATTISTYSSVLNPPPSPNLRRASSNHIPHRQPQLQKGPQFDHQYVDAPYESAHINDPTRNHSGSKCKDKFEDGWVSKNIDCDDSLLTSVSSPVVRAKSYAVHHHTTPSITQTGLAARDISGTSVQSEDNVSCSSAHGSSGIVKVSQVVCVSTTGLSVASVELLRTCVSQGILQLCPSGEAQNISRDWRLLLTDPAAIRNDLKLCAKTLAYVKGVCLGMWIVDAAGWLERCLSEGHAVSVLPYEMHGCLSSAIVGAPCRSRTYQRDHMGCSSLLQHCVFKFHESTRGLCAYTSLSTAPRPSGVISEADCAWMIFFLGGRFTSQWECSKCRRSHDTTPVTTEVDESIILIELNLHSTLSTASFTSGGQTAAPLEREAEKERWSEPPCSIPMMATKRGPEESEMKNIMNDPSYRSSISSSNCSQSPSNRPDDDSILSHSRSICNDSEKLYMEGGEVCCVTCGTWHTPTHLYRDVSVKWLVDVAAECRWISPQV